MCQKVNELIIILAALTLDVKFQYTLLPTCHIKMKSDFYKSFIADISTLKFVVVFRPYRYLKCSTDCVPMLMNTVFKIILRATLKETTQTKLQ